MGSGQRDEVVGAATLLLCLPGALAVVLAVRAGWVPTSDSATIATRAHDVLTGRSPLVGQYSLASRGEGTSAHSLGPLLYWVLAVPVRLGPAVAPAVAVAAVNTAALVGSARLAFRHGGRALGVAVTVGLLLLVRSFGLGQLTSIWNPTAALLPFVALVWVAWAVMVGRHHLLPLVAVLAALVAQCHLTYLIPALVLSAGAAAAVVHDARRPGVDVPLRRILAFTAGAVAVTWSAPFVEQVSGQPGNLSQVLRSSDGGERLGLGVGLDTVVRNLAGPPPWLRSGGTTRLGPTEVLADPSPIAVVVAALVVVGLAAVTIAAWRRRDRPVVVLGTTAGALLVLAAVVAAMLPRDQLIVAGYALWWTSAAGLVAWIALAWGAWRAAPGALATARTATRAAGRPVLVAAAVVALLVLAATPRHDPISWTYRPASTFAAAAVDATAPGGRYAVEAGDLGLVLPAAVGFRLRGAGRDPVLPSSIGRATGDDYSQRGERCDGVLHIVRAGKGDPAGDVLATTVVEQPDLPHETWELVLGPDEDDPSC